MNSDEIINNLNSIGKENEMSKWEIKLFIKLCLKKNILKKGQRLLLEYLQLKNDIIKLLNKRKNYNNKIIEILNNKHTENKFELPNLMFKLSEYSLKSWISICRWRQLQWSPRVIEINSGQFIENFIFDLERDVSHLLQLVQNSGLSFVDYDVPPIHLITLLITTIPAASSDFNILNILFCSKLVSDSSIENVIESNEQQNNNNNHNHNNNNNNNNNNNIYPIPLHYKNSKEINLYLLKYQELLHMMDRIIHEEYSIGQIWETVKRMTNENQNKKNGSNNNGNNNNQFNQNHIAEYPLLRISYDDITPPSQDNKFHTPELYFQTCQLLLNYFYQHYTTQHHPDNIDQHFEVLKILNEINSIYQSYETSNRYNNNNDNNHNNTIINRPKTAPDSRQSSNISPNQRKSRKKRSISTSIQSLKDSKNGDDTNLINHLINEKDTTIISNNWIDGQIERKSIGDNDDNFNNVIEDDYLNNNQTNNQTNNNERPIYHRTFSPSSSIPINTTSLKNNEIFDSNYPTIQQHQQYQNEKFKIITTTVLAYGGKELFLHLERKRINVTDTKLIVKGYLHGCSNLTQQECQLGDEILEINGMSVSGKRTKEIIEAIQSSHNEKLYQTNENGEQVLVATKVTIKLKRYFSSLNLNINSSNNQNLKQNKHQKRQNQLTVNENLVINQKDNEIHHENNNNGNNNDNNNNDNVNNSGDISNNSNNKINNKKVNINYPNPLIIPATSIESIEQEEELQTPILNEELRSSSIHNVNSADNKNKNTVIIENINPDQIDKNNNKNNDNNDVHLSSENLSQVVSNDGKIQELKDFKLKNIPIVKEPSSPTFSIQNSVNSFYRPQIASLENEITELQKQFEKSPAPSAKQKILQKYEELYQLKLLVLENQKDIENQSTITTDEVYFSSARDYAISEIADSIDGYNDDNQSIKKFNENDSYNENRHSQTQNQDRNIDSRTTTPSNESLLLLDENQKIEQNNVNNNNVNVNNNVNNINTSNVIEKYVEKVIDKALEQNEKTSILNNNIHNNNNNISNKITNPIDISVDKIVNKRNNNIISNNNNDNNNIVTNIVELSKSGKNYYEFPIDSINNINNVNNNNNNNSNDNNNNNLKIEDKITAPPTPASSVDIRQFSKIKTSSETSTPNTQRKNSNRNTNITTTTTTDTNSTSSSPESEELKKRNMDKLNKESPNEIHFNRQRTSSMLTAASFIVDTSAKSSPIFPTQYLAEQHIDGSPAASKLYRKRFLSSTTITSSPSESGSGGGKSRERCDSDHSYGGKTTFYRGKELFEADDNLSCATTSTEENISNNNNVSNNNNNNNNNNLIRPSQMLLQSDENPRSRLASEDLSVTDEFNFNPHFYIQRVSFHESEKGQPITARSSGHSQRAVSALTFNDKVSDEDLVIIKKSNRRDRFRRFSRAYPSALNDIFDYILEKYQNSDIYERSAALIGAWWKITYPHKLLITRLKTRKICNEIIFELLEDLTAKFYRSDKIKFKLMRHGAASQIQRVFRIWKISVLMNITKIQRAYRRYQTRKKILYIVCVVRAAIRVGRWLFRRRLRLKLPLGKRRLYRSVIKGFIDTIGFRIREEKYQKEIKAVSTRLLRQATRRGFRHNRKESDQTLRKYVAASKIQACIRGVLARKYYDELLKQTEKEKKIRAAMTLVKFRKKLVLRRRKILKCIIIQRWWRGTSLRLHLLVEILAGIVINNAWRRHRQYWKLKRRLRRIDHPILLTLHEILNLPSSSVETGSIKVVVSVWWSKLLHLVEQDDYSTIMQSKPPNIIRVSSYFTPTESEITPLPQILPTPNLRSTLQLQLAAFAQKKLPVQKNLNNNSNGDDFRKISLVQKVATLKATGSQKKKLTAAEALAEFAKTHGVRGVNVKFGTDHSSPKNTIVKNEKIEVLRKAVHKVSLQRSTILQFSQSIEAEHTKRQEENDNSSSSSSSSSSSDNESDEDNNENNEKDKDKSNRNQKNHSKVKNDKNEKDNNMNNNKSDKNSDKSSDSDSDSDGSENEDSFPALGGNLNENVNKHGVKPIKIPPKKSDNKKIDKRSSLAYDRIGHECVNTLGANLLLQNISESSYEDSSNIVTPSKIVDAFQVLSFSSETKRKPSLKPVPKKESVKVARSGSTDNPIFVSMGLGSLVGHSSSKLNKKSENIVYNVDLTGETLYIPGCHGDSVIKFDIYDGIRKIGTTTYHLSEDGHLLFWGNNNLSRNIALVEGSHHEAPRGRSRKFIPTSQQPLLKVGVVSLPAGVSRCGLCSINFRGSGPIRRKMRTRGFIKSFLNIWETFYLSLDGTAFHIYESRTDFEPIITIELTSLRGIHIELYGNSGSSGSSTTADGKKKYTNSLEDRYMIVLSTSGWDIIRLHFQEARVRETWVRTIMQAIHRLSAL